MKNCTHCGKVYSDWVDFCFDDGTVLVQERGGSVTVEFDLEETDAPLPGNLVFGGSSDVRAVQTKEEPAVLNFTPIPKAPVPNALKGYSTPKSDATQKPEAEQKPELKAAEMPPTPPPEAEPLAITSAAVSPLEPDEPRSKRTVPIFVAAAASSFVLLAALGGMALFASAGFYAQKKGEDKELALLEEAKVAETAPVPPDVVSPEPVEEPVDTDNELLDTDVAEEVAPEVSVAEMPTSDVPSQSTSTADQPVLDTPTKAASAPPVQRRPMAPRVVTGNPVTPKPRTPASEAPVAKVTTSDAPASVVNKPVTAEVAVPEPPEAPKRMVNVLVLLPGADGQPVNLTVDGTRMGEGKLWPVRLQLSEGPHRMVVEHKGEKTERSRVVEFKESMVIMTLN